MKKEGERERERDVDKVNELGRDKYKTSYYYINTTVVKYATNKIHF